MVIKYKRLAEISQNFHGHVCVCMRMLRIVGPNNVMT